MRNLIGTLLVSLLVALCLAACQQPAPELAVPSTSADSVIGSEWSLIEVDGKPSGVGADGKAPTLLLGADNRVSGYAGCNRLMGTYALTAAMLRFSQIATTKMACATGMELEQRFTAALNATHGYRLVDKRLELLADQGVLASFEKR